MQAWKAEMFMCICPCELVWHRQRDMEKAAQPPCKYWLKYDLPSIRLTPEARTAPCGCALHWDAAASSAGCCKPPEHPQNTLLIV